MATDKKDRASEFEQAGQERQMSLVAEFFTFVMENKKWWMIPIGIALALIGILVALSATGAAPFIYTLF